MPAEWKGLYSIEQVCRTSGYKKMVCESQTQTTQQAEETVAVEAPPTINTSSGSESVDVAMYQNPEGNNVFCGVMHAMITGKCLQSKVRRILVL